MAIFLKHTGCERCGSSDALAHYDDFSTFCFSCGVSSRATIPSFGKEESDDDEELVKFPTDLSHDFPDEVVQWIGPTGIKIEELIAHGYFFSKSAGGLVHVLDTIHSGSSRDCLRRGWGTYETRFFTRNVSKWGPKSKFHGSKESTYAYSYGGQPYYPLQPSSSCAGLQTNSRQGDEANWAVQRAGRHQLAIVEDSLSSIKVGRFVPAAPLFGSSIGKDKLTKLVKPFDEVFVWLDSNKLNAARKIAEQITMLGKKSRVIFTELDPKYVDNVEELV